jgi:cystathionine beta-synthase
MIGNSPLIKMKNMCKKEGIKCEVLAKCESFMPGGSLKDRVGKRTVHDLEKLGKIKPGYTLIEATSGNCGIGLALLGAVKGYEVIITMPDKMSLEKSYVLSGFGAHTIRTPTDAPFNTKESHIGVAKTLNSEIETSLFLDQVYLIFISLVFR